MRYLLAALLLVPLLGAKCAPQTEWVCTPDQPVTPLEGAVWAVADSGHLYLGDPTKPCDARETQFPAITLVCWDDAAWDGSFPRCWLPQPGSACCVED